MIRRLGACFAFAAAITGGTAALAASKPSHPIDQHLAAKASVSLVEAQRIAMNARPGAITDKELEKEKGGSGLRYSFDILSAGITYEVGVDAKTGQVLENVPEGSHPD
jgi:uncharacterized membrane protein YkoI